MFLMIVYSLMADRGNVYTEFLTVISEEQDYVLIYTFLPKTKENFRIKMVPIGALFVFLFSDLLLDSSWIIEYIHLYFYYSHAKFFLRILLIFAFVS